MLNISLLCFIGSSILLFILALLVLYRYLPTIKKLSKLQKKGYINNREIKRQSSKTKWHVVIMLFTGIIAIGLFFAGVASYTIQYKTNMTLVFKMPSNPSPSDYDGYFIIECDGPLVTLKPVMITEVWINSGRYNDGNISGNYRVEWIRFTLNVEDGKGAFGLMIPEDRWQFGIKVTDADKSELINPAYNTSFKFYSEGFTKFNIDIGINVTEEGGSQPNYYSKWIKATSNEIKIFDYSAQSDYQNSQIQAAGLVFGVTVVSIPILLKTVQDIIDKRDEWLK